MRRPCEPSKRQSMLGMYSYPRPRKHPSAAIVSAGTHRIVDGTHIPVADEDNNSDSGDLEPKELTAIESPDRAEAARKH